MQTVRLALDRLTPDPAQPRTAMAAAGFDRLVASIAARGLLQPVRVRPADADGNHVIVFGHRRVAALAQLGETHADCIVFDGLPDAATVLADQLAENLVRENLSPIEEAEGYRRYIALRAITAAQAAAELTVPASRISRGLALLELPGEVQRYVHTGWVHPDTGYYLSRLPAGEERDRLIARAVAGDLTRDHAARATRAGGSHPAPSPAIARVTCKLGGGRTLTVAGGAVTLDTLIVALEDVLRAARKARPQGWDVKTLAKVLADRAAKGGAA